MKSKILFIILTISTSLLYATKHEHIDENEIRYFKASPLDVNKQQQLRKGILWQAFLFDNPNWFVMFDENNKLPHKAFGEPIQLSGSSNIGGNLKKHLKSLNKQMKEAAANLEFEEAARMRDEIRKLEASELEINLNPKISQYNLKNKIHPKGRSTMGMPGVKVNKAAKKWKPKK